VTYEVDTNGGDVALRVCVVGKTKEQAGLSDTGVADEEELEKVIVSMSKASAGLSGSGNLIDSAVGAPGEGVSVSAVSYMLQRSSFQG